ncbi:MAG: M16 family metallopeptidase [Gemmatimonadota bacterium]
MQADYGRPEPGPSRPYTFPPAETATQENGPRLIAVGVPGAPVVTVLASVDAGAEREAITESGLAALTASVLTEGVCGGDADQLASRSERLGAEVESEASWVNVSSSITVLRENLAGAIELIADILGRPTLPERGSVRLRDERLAELSLLEAEPRSIADRAFLLALFPGHRNGLPRGGDANHVAALQPEDVRRFHQRCFTDGATTVIAAGDVTTADLERYCRGLHWPAPGAAASAALASGSASSQRRVVTVRRSGAPQSEIRFGHPSVRRSHPDFYALTVMNAILGGLFNSRINLNLRERRAWTYGAFTTLEWRRHVSLFEASTAVRSDATIGAIDEILAEIDRMRESPVSDEELSLAISYLVGVFPIRFETTEAIATAVASRESFQLEHDYFDRYRDRVAAVTRDEVLRVAGEHLAPERGQLIVVGDTAPIVGQLERYGEVAQWGSRGEGEGAE